MIGVGGPISQVCSRVAIGAAREMLRASLGGSQLLSVSSPRGASKFEQPWPTSLRSIARSRD